MDETSHGVRGRTVSREGGPEPTTLEGEVSFPMLVLYGLGTTVGAGIYALTGEVAGSAGIRAPLSFLLSAALAGVTAIGFAELTGRLPLAAGEAVFADRALGRRWITRAVGLAVLLAGVVAASAIARAFGGYVTEVVEGPRWLMVLMLIGVLTVVAAAGARESVLAAGLVTVVELGGLALVIWSGRDGLADIMTRADELVGPPTDTEAWGGVLGGAFLAFFAFLGFEDMDSVAEETRNAPVALPRAILLTLGITTLLYMTIASVAVIHVAPDALAVVVSLLAVTFELAWLARLTSATTMGIFVVVNAALVVIKRRDGPTTTFQVPGWIPLAGIVAASAMFLVEFATLIS